MRSEKSQGLLGLRSWLSLRHSRTGSDPSRAAAVDPPSGPQVRHCEDCEATPTAADPGAQDNPTLSSPANEFHVTEVRSPEATKGNLNVMERQVRSHLHPRQRRGVVVWKKQASARESRLAPLTLLAASDWRTGTVYPLIQELRCLPQKCGTPVRDPPALL